MSDKTIKQIQYGDALERHLGEAFVCLGVAFIHESAGRDQLDFYLPDYGVQIEVKRYECERTAKQLAKHENVILLQGERAVKSFIDLISKNQINDR